MEDRGVHPSEYLEFKTTNLGDRKPHATEDRGVHPSEYLEFKTANLGDLKPSAEGQHGVASPVSPARTRSRASYFDDRRGSLHPDQDAFNASKQEHRMTFSEGLRLYPKAVCWSFLISICIVMEGYDTALINSFYAFPEFRRVFGVPVDGGGYEVETKWQTSLSNGAAAGAVLGLFANGVLTERFGYRHTMIGALIALAGCVFLVFFAVNIEMMLAGQILCGLSWGIFSTLTTTYAAEVVPLNLRGYLTANVNACWLIGQIVALGTLRGLIDMESTWSYRIPFGLQWGWIVFLLIVALLAPESPWWLVRNRKTDEAEKSLLRLTRRGYNFDVKSTVSIMDYTDATEKKLNGNKARDLSYLQCFKGTNLRRTEIACMIFMIQNLCGLPVISYAAYFYTRIGFDQKRSFDLTIAMHGIAILGALLSILLMKFFGRRSLYLAGLSIQFVILLAAGTVSCLPETTTTLWATAGLIILFIFVFDSAVAPLTYCIVAEVPSTRLRVKTVVLARVSYNICALITNTLQTRMLNPTAWNWRGRSSFFWGGACALCIVYCYFRLPDFRGLTYLELDILFEKRAKAKQFSTFQKSLASTGYFSFRDAESREPLWTETRRSDAFQAQTSIVEVGTSSKEK